jgi:hypothetical protein
MKLVPYVFQVKLLSNISYYFLVALVFLLVFSNVHYVRSWFIIQSQYYVVIYEWLSLGLLNLAVLTAAGKFIKFGEQE